MASARSPLVGRPDGWKPRSSRRLLLAGVATLAMMAILAIAGVRVRNGMLVVKAPSTLIGEDIVNDGPGGKPQQLAQFDSGKLYKFDADTDLEHPNRIDNYGCLFSNCDDDSGAGGMLGKVNELKKQLAKFAKMQKVFEEKLDTPVQTTIQVTAGEPGLLGRRGPRGPTGYTGRAGPRGSQGRPGFPGPSGKSGRRGKPGPMGQRGETGDRGPKGPKGPRGVVGPRGPQGPQGPEGEVGPPGFDGDKGVEGQPGQKGNMGPKGLAPQGPPGPSGNPGAKGPTGGRGPPGARGAPGPQGNAGGTGPPGISGFQGMPGKDGKQWKPGKCGVNVRKEQKNICCGRSQIHWAGWANAAVTMDINTAECGFSDDAVMYFPYIRGNGYQWALHGANTVQNSWATGFTLRTTSVYYPWIQGNAGFANDMRWIVSWCGVGKSSQPTVQSVCCDSGPNDWDYWWVGGIYKYRDTNLCEFRGAPQYLTAVGGKKDMHGVFGASSLYFGWNVWYKNFLILPNKDPNFPWRTYWDGAKRDDWRLNYCGLGDTFPTGEMQVTAGSLQEENYPCQGVRMITDNKIVSNTGEVCCGISDVGGWESQTVWVRSDWGSGYNKPAVQRRIDTSSCQFKAHPRPVWITSIKGKHVWSLSGTASYADWSEKGFTTQMAGWKEDALMVDAAKAKEWGWQVQWCGFGVKL